MLTYFFNFVLQGGCFNDAGATYGVAPVYHEPNLHPPEEEFRSAVHIQGRAMIVGFLAENSLTFPQIGKESLCVLF